MYCYSLQFKQRHVLLFLAGLTIASIHAAKHKIHEKGLQEYCETEEFHASCSNSDVILMQHSLYGRMRFGRCIDRDYGYVGCSTDVLYLTDRRCSGRRSCIIPVPNSEFKQITSCPKDLKPYFEAVYTCIKVQEAADQPCKQSNFLLPDSSTGYIANTVTLETGRGSADCPWLIQALQGQQVNITLLDFSRSLPTQTNLAVPESYDVCKVYAVIRERYSNSRGLTICSGEERQRHVYTSIGHAVEIRMLRNSKVDTADTDYFLLKYEIIGCGDPTLTGNTLVKRNQSHAIVGCSFTEHKWLLTCSGQHWQGTLGNCTQDNTPSLGQISLESIFLSFEISLTIIISIAIGMGIIVLIVGVMCISSSHADKNSSQIAHSQYYQRHNVHEDDILPPPPLFLMKQGYNIATENEYAYISELPPPSSPSQTVDSTDDSRTQSYLACLSIDGSRNPSYMDRSTEDRDNYSGYNHRESYTSASAFCERKKVTTIVNCRPNGELVTDCSWTYSEVSVDCGKYSVAQGCQIPYSESPKYFEFDPSVAVKQYNGYYKQQGMLLPTQWPNSDVVPSIHCWPNSNTLHNDGFKTVKSMFSCPENTTTLKVTSKYSGAGTM